MTDKERYEGLEADVASLLLKFRTLVNKDHGEMLLNNWDQIRGVYAETTYNSK